MPIKSFRGLIKPETQDRIVLHTINGKTGYRIVKFRLMSNIPHEQDAEHTVMIWKVKRTDAQMATTMIDYPDFSNQTLLGAGINLHDATGSGHGYWEYTIFDGETFNQDIYITHTDKSGTSPAVAVNYYIELETVSLDPTQNMVATLKDIRNNVSEAI
jgi:hypothetical protein